MVGYLQPLAHNFAIVNELGYPTEYFIRWAQQKQIDIGESVGEARALEIVKTFLTEHPLQAGSGIDLTPDGDLNNSPTISAKAQEILDQIVDVQGSILFRGVDTWKALSPGTSGHVLSTNGPSADPSWVAQSGGGGGGGDSVKIFATPSSVPSSSSVEVLSSRGFTFTPLADTIKVIAIVPYMLRVVGQSYRVFLAEMASASLTGPVIAYKDFSVSVSDTAWHPRVVDLDTHITLDIAKQYYMGVTLTDYSSSGIMMPYSGGISPVLIGSPILCGQSTRTTAATFDPAGGQTIATYGDASYCTGLITSF